MCRLTARVGAKNPTLDFAPLAFAGWIMLVAVVPARAASTDYTNFSGIGAGASAGTPGFTGNPRVMPQAGEVTGRDWAVSIRAVESLTLTDNVFLAPSGQEQGDMVLGLAVPLGLRHDSAHVKLWVDYVPTYYLYTTNRDSNNLQNNLHSLLTVAPVEE